jgi:hypothetical protein
MTVPQRQVRIREVWFTLRFGRTITIATSCALRASTNARKRRIGIAKVPLIDSPSATFNTPWRMTTTVRCPDGTGGDQDRRVKDLEMLKCPAPKARLSKRSGEQETFRGTRASANTSGPDFIRALGPVKLRSKDSAPNEENPFLLPDRF